MIQTIRITKYLSITTNSGAIAVKIGPEGAETPPMGCTVLNGVEVEGLIATLIDWRESRNDSDPAQLDWTAIERKVGHRLPLGVLRSER